MDYLSFPTFLLDSEVQNKASYDIINSGFYYNSVVLNIENAWKLLIFQDRNSFEVVRLLVWQFLSSPLDNNNLVPCYSWIREVIVKCKQICKFFCPGLYVNFLFNFNSFEKTQKLQNWSALSKKWQLVINTACLNWGAFSYEDLVDAKVQNNVSQKISRLNLICNWVSLNATFKSNWVFWNSKIYKKIKFRTLEQFKVKVYFPRHSCTRYYTIKIAFSMKIFTADLFQLLTFTAIIILLGKWLCTGQGFQGIPNFLRS